MKKSSKTKSKIKVQSQTTKNYNKLFNIKKKDQSSKRNIDAQKEDLRNELLKIKARQEQIRNETKDQATILVEYLKDNFKVISMSENKIHGKLKAKNGKQWNVLLTMDKTTKR